MKQVRTADLRDAVPVDGRGHRSPQTLLLIEERDRLLVEAARFYPGASDRETARRLRFAMSLYRAGRWRRDRSEPSCPSRHRGTITEALWCLLKVRDAIPSERLVRLVLSRSA